jgi:hypothetical protein
VAINQEIRHGGRIYLVLQCLPRRFFLLAFMRSWLPFSADVMDRGEHPREDVPEVGGPTPRL